MSFYTASSVEISKLSAKTYASLLIGPWSNKWNRTTKILKTALPSPFWLLLVFLLARAVLSQPTPVAAQSVSVRYREGLSRGFLVVRTPDGRQVADGDSSQVAHGERITSRMTFRFKDGSTEDETTVFSQHGTFRLLSDHVLQKGPVFKRPMETSIDATTGQVVVRYTDDDGKEKVVTERLDLPSDLSNGLLLTLLKNVQPSTPSTTVSYLAAAPKPSIVKLVITAQGEEAFSTSISKHKAIHFVVKVDIGGTAGVIAHLAGKQSPDTHVWVLAGEAPSFVGLEGPYFGEGAIWRIDLVSPVRQGPVR